MTVASIDSLRWKEGRCVMLLFPETSSGMLFEVTVHTKCEFLPSITVPHVTPVEISPPKYTGVFHQPSGQWRLTPPSSSFMNLMSTISYVIHNF